MQEPYHIKVSLREYYYLFLAGKWEIPDFSERCLICNAKGCAKYHGFYTRRANCPLTAFFTPDLPIIRLLCYGKGTNKICDHRTFSLLPLVLVPYRQLTLKFMILALWLRLSNKLSLVKSLTAIEIEFPNLNNFEDIANFINISAQLEWEKIAIAALNLYITSPLSLADGTKNGVIFQNSEDSLLSFLKMAIEYESIHIHPPIRGPDALAWDFYQSNGGACKLSPFLFGIASQHRN